MLPGIDWICPHRDVGTGNDNPAVLLAYADESFSKRFFFIVAVIATPEQVKSLSDALDDYVNLLAAEHAEIRGHEELHGYEVFHGNAGWTVLGARQRVKVFIDVFRIIAESGVRIAIRGLDIAAQRKRYSNPHPPYSVVLTKIFEKIQSVASQEDDLALLICDEYHEDDRHRKLLTSYRKWRTPTSSSMKIDRIIDTIHFTPSHESRLIQAADMIAFVRLRRSTITSPDPREATAIKNLWESISNQIIVDYIWSP